MEDAITSPSIHTAAGHGQGRLAGLVDEEGAAGRVIAATYDLLQPSARVRMALIAQGQRLVADDEFPSNEAGYDRDERDRPSGFLRDATSLDHSPKSKIVAVPF